MKLAFTQIPKPLQENYGQILLMHIDEKHFKEKFNKSNLTILKRIMHHNQWGLS